MATTQLQLYNMALGEYLGERTLSSLSENREPRRILDEVWANGAVNYCLEQGQWNFAMRASKITSTPSVTLHFGYTYAFEKPADCLSLSKVCVDEYYTVPLLAYIEESGFWYADAPDLYVGYISNDAAFGGDMSNWPETFVQVVASYLASKSAMRITQNGQTADGAFTRYRKNLADARSKDAMQQPTQFLPSGSWTRSRRGSGGDRGSKGQLIG
jgi:hypothetical protein